MRGSSIKAVVAAVLCLPALLVIGHAEAAESAEATGSIAGHVMRDGQPVALALVKVYAEGNTKTAAVPPVRTNTQGEYSLGGLADGVYVVTVYGTVEYATQWWDHAPTRSLAEAITVAGGATVPAIDFDVVAAGAPTGDLIVSSANPTKLKRGTRTEVTIKGSGFVPMSSAHLSGNGIKRLVLKGSVTDTQVRVAIALSAKATRGERTLTLVRADGATATLLLRVV